MAKRKQKTIMSIEELEQKQAEKQFKMIDVDDIIPNPFNKNKMGATQFKALKDNLSNPHVGFTIPILVMPHPDHPDGGYMVVDGEHRHRAASQLGYRKIPCIVLPPLSESMLKYVMVESNNVHGVTSDSDLKDLIQSIQQSGEEWIETLDVWKDACVNRPVEEDTSKYDLDEDDLGSGKIQTNQISLYLTDEQIDDFRRITGQFRLRDGITLEETVMRCVLSCDPQKEQV